MLSRPSLFPQRQAIRIPDVLRRRFHEVHFLYLIGVENALEIDARLGEGCSDASRDQRHLAPRIVRPLGGVLQDRSPVRQGQEDLGTAVRGQAREMVKDGGRQLPPGDGAEVKLDLRQPLVGDPPGGEFCQVTQRLARRV